MSVALTTTHDNSSFQRTIRLVFKRWHDPQATGIITGQKLGQNHRFQTWPDGLTDVVVPQRLVAKKGAQRCVEAVLTLNSPLQLYDVSGVGAAFFANVFLPR